MPCDMKVCQCRKEKVSMRDRTLCKHWSPSQNSKYFNCEFYELEKHPCPFEFDDGTSPCETCPYHAKLEGRGRPNHTGVNWSDKDSINQYRREQYRGKR